MAYNKYAQKKEHRREYRSNTAKSVDKSCRNHGSCPWCQGNRMYKYKILKLKISDILKEFENE